MENEEVDPGFDSEVDEEDIWYNDDPVLDSKIDWFYKIRSFTPIAILLAVTTFFLPNTVGGRISINSNASNFEFGQGSSLIATCTDNQSISITPAANFVGTVDGVQRFSLKGLKVSEIPVQCRNFMLDLGVYNTNAAVAPYYFMHPSYSRIGVYFDSGSYNTILECGVSITTDSPSGFTVNFTEPVNVSRDELFLTLESRDKFGTYLNNQSEEVRFDSGDCASYGGNSASVVNIGNAGASSNGTILGAVGVVADGVKSNFVFDSSSSKKIPFNRAVSADFTLAAWMKIPSYPGATKPITGTNQWWSYDQIIGGDAVGAAGDFGFAISNGFVGFGTSGTSDYTVWADSQISLNDWHYVVATRQKSNAKVELFVDGALVGSGTTLSANVNLNSSATNVIASDPFTSSRTFNGTIGVVQQYSRILTANEQLSNYMYLNKRYSSSSSYACALYGNSCSIGDTGPGGGTVFYYKADGFSCGPSYKSTGGPNGNQCHYLEYAPNTWSGGASDPTKTWSGVSCPSVLCKNLDSEQNTSENIGKGYSFTLVSTQTNTSFAQPAARAYGPTRNGKSYTDWYLPSGAELNQLCKHARGLRWTSDATACNATGIGTAQSASLLGFQTNRYNASSQFDTTGAWFVNFNNGTSGDGGTFNNSGMYVRPIRAF